MNLPADNHASTTSPGWAGLLLRLAYLGYLGAVALGSVLLFFSVCQRNTRIFAGALVAGGLAMAFRAVLLGRIGLPEAEVILNEESDFVENEDGRSRPVGELVALLQQLDGLEKARGSGHFDPWALQSVRSEIRTVMHGNPELQQLLKSTR